MIANHNTSRKGREARGISVMIVAVGMIFILGMAGLAIDLASLYVGRSQAQRAADAAPIRPPPPPAPWAARPPHPPGRPSSKRAHLLRL